MNILAIRYIPLSRSLCIGGGVCDFLFGKLHYPLGVDATMSIGTSDEEASDASTLPQKRPSAAPFHEPDTTAPCNQNENENENGKSKSLAVAPPQKNPSRNPITVAHGLPEWERTRAFLHSECKQQVIGFNIKTGRVCVNS